LPELPEVQTVLNGLEAALEGRTLETLECYYPGTVIKDPSLDFDPLPAKPIAFLRRGKYMLIELDSAATLIIHLRMTGKLVAAEMDREPLPHERARFYLDAGKLLHFIDIRTFGKIVLCKTENIANYFPDLGLEPLSADFTAAALAERIKNKKAPVKTVLLDQSIVAGLGNIYVCELLYRADIDPCVSAKDLKPKQIKAIVRETIAVLNEAIARGGTSVSDFRRIDDKTGEFQHFLQVYQKPQCPKGHEVRRIVQAGRSTFYCPVCQK